MTRVIVGGSSSNCSACGGNAHPDDTAHVRGGPDSMWEKGSSLDDENGCGVMWDEEPFYVYGSVVNLLDGGEQS